MTSSKGIFTVGDSEQFTFDYLFDGGWWQGEIGVYNLSGMETYTLGSVEYIQEVARRAISNSNDGYVVMTDRNEGAKYSSALSWEGNFNQGEYLGKKTFSMNSGDRFAFIFTQNNTLAELADSPENYTQPGKIPLFSITEANPDSNGSEQFVTLDGSQVFGFEATHVDKSPWKNHDYNEAIFKVLGATGEAASYQDHAAITTNSFAKYNNFLKSDIGQTILSETEVGVFTVEDSGQFTFDYLFDGGWWQGELGVYNLSGMETYTPGSVEYIQEASKRAISNSNDGYVVMTDRTEGAKHSSALSWEGNFNKGEHLGEKTFSMNSGDRFAFIFTQNNELAELADAPENYTQPGKMPLFSIAEANPDGNAPHQFAALDRNGTFGFEATRINQDQWSDQDYNEVVFRVLGATSEATHDYKTLRHDYRDFLKSDIAQTIINESEQQIKYKSRQQILNNGSLTIGEFGEVTIDAINDDGRNEGEVGIFSLEGMEKYELGSSLFIQNAASRALSNSSQGYVVFQDSLEGAYSGRHNQGTYQGSKTFELTPGGKYGLMLVKNETISQIFEDPSSTSTYFSMSGIDYLNTQQMVYRAESDNLMVVGMEEDTTGGYGDYNDIVLSIEGATIHVPEDKEISWDWYKGINPIASDDSKSTSKDSAISISSLLNNDYVFGGNVNFDSFNAENTIGLVNGNGNSLTYDPNGQFDGLQTGETAIDSFTYTITDRAGKTDTATVKITVRGFDDDRTLYGDTGDDSLVGGTGNDYLDGLEGNDILNGRAGDDTLVGSSGDDTLSGSSGVDFLYGGIGDDIINGGSDNDNIFTGDGKDIVVYSSPLPERGRYYAYQGYYNSDIDTIEDFTVGIDKIDLSSVISGNPLDHSLVSLSGSYPASLNYDGYTLMTFENVSAINLDDSSNFIF